MHLEVGGAAAASTSIKVPPDSTVDVPVKYHAPSSGALTVTVDDSVGYAADNRRVVLLDPRLKPRVLVVASAVAGGGGALPNASGFYLARVLDASSEEENGFEPAVIDGAGLGRLEPQEMRKYAVVALLSTRGLDRRAREALIGFVGSGGGLVLAAGPELGRQPAGRRPRRAAAARDRDAGRPAPSAGGDRPASPDLPALRTLDGQSRPGSLRPCVADVAGRLERRGNVHRRDAGPPRTAGRLRACAPVHIGPRSPLERFSAAPGVRPVRARVGAFCRGNQGGRTGAFDWPGASRHRADARCARPSRRPSGRSQRRYERVVSVEGLRP